MFLFFIFWQYFSSLVFMACVYSLFCSSMGIVMPNFWEILLIKLQPEKVVIINEIIKIFRNIMEINFDLFYLLVGV
ncbi:hypothetical protein A2483_03505 [Candidatus Peregrinibacteria bacterium RIFOXYC2_FULL_33_13]|nr:MAG: hypothetical protein A2483_03505 [Candidatus Peregrinibacteria bacterium RIFOXYC2_FULL_33_13]